MNTSEFSLFSKSNLNRIPECNSFVSEELEAEEDEIRRNEEIREMMHNAFDDLDDDNQSVNSSSYLASLSGCCNSKTTHSEPSPWNCNPIFNGNRINTSNNHNYLQTENEQSQYLVKIQKLELELSDLQKHFKEEKSKWLEKFFIEEEEKKLAQKKHEEVNKLFYESQVMLLQRENELKEYQEKLEVCEEEKNKALEEVKLCQLTIEELEQRLLSQERKNHSKEEEVDDLKRKFSSSDEEKFSGYRKEIQNLNEKLTLKDKKYQDLELQLQDLQQLHKSVIAEKSDVITKLSSNLETCQAQCQKLMLNSNRILEMEKNNSESRQSLPANMRSDSKLFDELFQAYATVKGKSSEIKFLQEQLKSCVKQIKSGKEIESQNVQDIHILKEKLADLEIKNDQLVRENRQLKNDKLNSKQETIVDESDNETTNLNKQLEISVGQCNEFKNMYFEANTAKEKLLFQNQQLQADVDKLKNENSVLNEIVKTLNNDMPLVPVHCDSFAQESMYLEYCPQDNNSNQVNLSVDNELEFLKKKLMECEDQLKRNNEQYAKQLEVLQNGIKNYISNTETQHHQQLVQLEEECAKKISELESKHSEQFVQFETEFKELVLKVSTEEIKNLSNIFQKHFDDVSETMTRLRNELEEKSKLAAVSSKQLESAKEEIQKRDQVIENLKSKHDNSSKKWNEQMNSMNEKHEKLLLELDKIYTKYKTTRKIAIDLRELLLRYQKFYTQTLNEIQNYLNETLDCKTKNEKSITKFDITKEDLIVPDAEINAAIFAIKKQLESLKHSK